MTHFTLQRTRDRIAGFRTPDRSQYPELDDYTRDELYEDCFGGGGLYLATRMARTLNLRPDQIVLDLGCGKGSASILLARHYGVKVIAVDLWTSATFLNQKFTQRGYHDRIVPLNLDVTKELPFAEDYFDAIFCLNSFNFYGGNAAYLQHIFKHLKPGGRFCLGSEVLSAEFTTAQLQNPPYVYAFKLPAPLDHIDVFEDDFKKQHTPPWWRDLFETSGLVHVEHCAEVEDADVLYEELARYEHEHDLDPFDVDICLQQMDWGATNQPRKTLFVMTATKL